MLKITIPATELYDEEQECFIVTEEKTLQLEHSLVSVSKWESKWCKPFLIKENKKTIEEIIDYIRCMTLTQNVDNNVYNFINSDIIRKVSEYIEAPMTATVFNKNNNSKNKEIITSEIIYYWMISMNIPLDCQKWHLNRLLTLINVCSIKNQPPKKMSKKELMSRNKALNEERRKLNNSRG